jgi:Flp pilus assembly protein TadB
MAERGQADPSLREQAGALKEDFSPSRLADSLEDAASDRPMVPHLLAFDTVLKALAAAVVVALILMLLTSAKVAAVALVLVFFGAWLGLARLSYDRRRDTRDAREAGDGERDDDDSE